MKVAADILVHTPFVMVRTRARVAARGGGPGVGLACDACARKPSWVVYRYGGQTRYITPGVPAALRSSCAQREEPPCSHSAVEPTTDTRPSGLHRFRSSTGSRARSRGRRPRPSPRSCRTSGPRRASGLCCTGPPCRSSASGAWACLAPATGARHAAVYADTRGATAHLLHRACRAQRVLAHEIVPPPSRSHAHQRTNPH